MINFKAIFTKFSIIHNNEDNMYKLEENTVNKPVIKQYWTTLSEKFP